MNDFWITLLISFKLAFLTTIILFIIGLPVAYILSFKEFKFKSVVEALTTLPLVLPPTVLGFYYLIAFSPDSVIGKFVDKLFGIKLVFSFEGILLASIIYSFPFMTQPLMSGFRSFPKNIIEAAYTLGKSKLETLFRVILPNIKSSVLTAITLTFAHTIGEFGVVLMVGGSIPGETKVASIAIYEEVESLNYHEAHKYALILLLISLFTLITLNLINKKLDYGTYK